MRGPEPNAVVEYVDEAGRVVAVAQFYDPGLDIGSWLTREMKERGVWKGLHLAYGAGRPKIVATRYRE